jgi:hypothetical protein
MGETIRIIYDTAVNTPVRLQTGCLPQFIDEGDMGETWEDTC